MSEGQLNLIAFIILLGGINVRSITLALGCDYKNIFVKFFIIKINQESIEEIMIIDQKKRNYIIEFGYRDSS